MREYKAQKGEQSSVIGLDLSLLQVSEASLVEAKAEEDLEQMIDVVSDRNTKVEKMWDLHQAYRYVRIWCSHRHDLIDSIHTLKRDEQLDNFVILPKQTILKRMSK